MSTQERIEYLENCLESAYVMLDRFSDEISHEAYHEIEAILGNAIETGFPATSYLDELEAKLNMKEQEIEELRERKANQ